MPDPLTPADLDALDRAVAKTQHPWSSDDDRVNIEKHQARADLVDAAPALLAEVRRLRAALNCDRTGLAAALVAVIERCKGTWWVTEGRGSYEWDDERYKDETRMALDAVIQIATLALRESGALVTRTFNGPLDAALSPPTPSGEHPRDPQPAADVGESGR